MAAKMAPILTRRALILCILLLAFDASIATNFFKYDPYKVLGIKPTATNDAIQKAYRRRAKETHPDKNSSPNANEEFRRVTDAFEILGDAASRKQYDNKMRQENQRRRRAREQERRREEMQRQQNERARRERQRRQNEMMGKARSSWSRMAKISNYQEFEEKMLDSTKSVYRTHCLIMFVANKKAEKNGEEDYFFPYPFAGEAGWHNPYEGKLQTAKVRFNAQTELTRLFRAKSQQNTPHIVFAQKGDHVGSYRIFQSRRKVDVHREFTQWVESQMVTQATIANHHSLPVELLVMRDGHVVSSHETLFSGYQRTMTLHAGDRIMAFDKRLDTFPGAKRMDKRIPVSEGVLLLDAIVTSSTNVYTIERRQCYDLSTQCHEWTVHRGRKNQQCSLNPEFMHQICPFTCGVCSENIASGLHYLLFHHPIHRFPSILQSSIESGRYFMEDMRNITKLRKNVAAALIAAGLLIAFNIALFNSVSGSSLQPKHRTESKSSFLSLVFNSFLLLVAASVCMGMKWIVSTPIRGTPMWMKDFIGDLVGVTRDPDVYLLILVVAIATGIYIRALLSCIISRRMGADTGMFYMALLMTLIGGTLTVFSVMMGFSQTALRWEYSLNYRKNAGFVLFGVGACAGVGLVSLKRLVTPLLKTLFTPLFLMNIILLAAASSYASMDPHFQADMMHVIQLRKNAAFGFIVFGVLIGKVVERVFKK